ncbi:MAG: transglutaminase-like domain-containing protein [Geobacteraceae bacterium]|nr:transglutaminase-like domain-containing protein [Geobacteraceae bacterium]
MKRTVYLVLSIVLLAAGVCPAMASSLIKLGKPPLSEHWFGIYVDNERVGFYRQKISETSDGYRFEGDGSVRMKVMGFSREVSSHEEYLVAKNLTMRTFDVQQIINGVPSRVSGQAADDSLRIKIDNNGKITEKYLKFKGDIYPSPALNLFPLMCGATPGKSYKTMTFDAEEIKIKEVTVTVLGEDKTPDGSPALKLRNNLYPFVTNDIWVDDQGDTLMESVRDGLVTTKAESPKLLGSFIRDLALSKKDLIYDFSLVRANPPILDSAKLTGLAVEISGWNDALPLLQEGGQLVAKSGEGRITVRTGRAVPPALAPAAAVIRDIYLKPAEKIESTAPEIVAKARELAAGKKDAGEIAQALTAWTAGWLKNTVEDGGSALVSLKERTGNCQTHARLYTALARAAGIPTRFVSGLVYQQGKGFLYHSWAESLLGDRWVAVDPTFNQLPADVTHLKFFEGQTQEDMAPIIAIIGRIRIAVLDAKYN